MSVLAEILIALAAIMVVSTVTVIVIARVLYRRLRRSRALNGAVLRVRTRVSVGPNHEILRLRLRLRDSLASGQAAVDLAVQSGGPHGELQRLVGRLQNEGTRVESQLLLLATERDPVVLRETLPVASRRVDQITGLVGRVRSVVAAGLGVRTDDTLTTLGADVDREIAAVGAGVAELHALTLLDGLPTPERTSMQQTSAHRLDKRSTP
ncbi:MULTISPECIES: hypothetical protein [unclassified Cryobacterium]|uniref:hypothetical protein n=1 Tax=unclassified Cryobacterium TaxID=2649013 RepID=UPI00106A1F01|nr:MULTISPECIES: hypothetical protein [unclassified Cryobacterium]TFC55539.1 hypothetical protein E3O68_05840 [Cryobacterium sp. TMB3-1-2]TFC72905.1 hypothetical protein E3T21_05695 [Cryobacterium sp. TMB3-15]TFC76411.1 hypothetical protein E3T22_10835 [Cryobacterium sp. TMB3-10]TFC88578.1 hypothetical protein E3T19_10025 [Cryobacterium sp. TMT4-31]TFD43626.1 hypothetical protein E3T58_07450 [Cryobacterium sp. TMB3-12]